MKLKFTVITGRVGYILGRLCRPEVSATATWWGAWLAVLLGIPTTLFGHPLPDRTFDRALQVWLEADGFSLDYELGLNEVTLATELLYLAEEGQVPLDRQASCQLFGELFLPIAARGVLARVDGVEVELLPVPPVTTVITDHVQVRLRFRGSWPAPLEKSGRHTLEIIDTNLAEERGYRRIALDCRPGIHLEQCNVPRALEPLPLLPTWEMTPEQEALSHRAVATFLCTSTPVVGQTTDAKYAAVEKPETNVKEGPEGIAPAKVLESGNDLRPLLGEDEHGLWGRARRHADNWLPAPLRASAVWLMVLGGAFVFGMLHAIKPGHGKTMVAAYLVGEQGTAYHALLLGIVTALTHTGSVLFVALILRAFAGSPWANPAALSFWLTLVSGLLLIVLGVTLFWRRWQGREDLLHIHGPGGHVHLPDGRVVNVPAAPRRGGLVAMGFSGGLVPCDDAVLLLLAAIGAGKLREAVFLLLAFSAGLAAVLVALGILVVKVKGFATGHDGSHLWANRLQLVSAALITLIGIGLCWKILLS